MPFPSPPLPEQKRIVAILTDRLSTIDKARTATEAQLKAAKALPAAYLREVFDSPEAQKWKRKKLGEIVQLKNGINFTSQQKGTGILTIDVLNMYSDSSYVDLSKLYRVDTQPSFEYLLQPNDVLFVRSSVKREGVAWSALFPGCDEPVTFCSFLIRARFTTNKVVPEFLINYLRSSSVRDILISKSGTGTITNISQGNLETLTVPIPSKEEQKENIEALNNQLKAVKGIQQSLQSQLNTINKLPAALLRQAFNGEL